jgi:hypothetical protein
MVDNELNKLEGKPDQFRIQSPTIIIEKDHWTLVCDCFYFDVIQLLRNLIADTKQMQAAELRFSQGCGHWWIPR